MKFILPAVFGLLLTPFPVQAESSMTGHVDDPARLLPAETAGRLEDQLGRVALEGGLRVLLQFHEHSPTEAEDSVPGAFMRALSAQLGVLEEGVLMVYFADEDDWRVWIGDELTARFVGQPGTAEEFTQSGAMHDAKEAWLKEVFAVSERRLAEDHSARGSEPDAAHRRARQAEALIDGLAAKFPAPPGALIEAAGRGDVAMVRELLLRRAALEARDEKGRTALLAATHANQVDAAKVLIDAGADVNARDDLQDTPYLYAGAEGRREILQVTLTQGADLKSVNRFGGTALIPAAEKGHLENVRMLLQTDIAINHVNRPGWTALYEAVMRPRGQSETYREIVQALLAAGADVTIADKQGRTPEQRAREVGNADLAELIRSAGGSR